MTLFEQLLYHADHWTDRLDRERDLVTRLLSREGAKPHLTTWLDQLDVERAKHLTLTAGLEQLRQAQPPALLLSMRPTFRMLAAALRPTSLRKRA